METICYCEICKKFELGSNKVSYSNSSFYHCNKDNTQKYSRIAINIDAIRDIENIESYNLSHFLRFSIPEEKVFDEKNSYYNDFGDFKISYKYISYIIPSDQIKELIINNIEKSNEELIALFNEHIKIKRDAVHEVSLYVNLKETYKKDKIQFFIDNEKQKGWKSNTINHIDFYSFKNFALNKYPDTFNKYPYITDLGYPTDILSLLLKYPCFEILVKAGCTKKVYESLISYINVNGTNPKEILKLDKDKIKILKDFLNNKYELVFNHHYHIDFADNFISRIQNLDDLTYDKFNKIYEKFIKLSDNYVPINESSLKLSINSYFYLIELIIREKYDVSTLFKYLAEECKEMQGIINIESALSYLKDYIIAAKELNIEYIKYPKSLKLEHDKMNYLKLLKKNEINAKKFKERVTELEDYLYENKKLGYKIILPKESLDLKREGASLSHCVGSYIDRFIKGDSNIFFMRTIKDEEKSLVTIELDNNFFLVQSRGFCNRFLNKEEEAFLNDWLKHVKNIRINNSNKSA